MSVAVYQSVFLLEIFIHKERNRRKKRKKNRWEQKRGEERRREEEKRGCAGTDLVFLKFRMLSFKEHEYIINLLLSIKTYYPPLKETKKYSTSAEMQNYILRTERDPYKLLKGDAN